MADQPGKSPIGIIKGPAPKTPPQTQTVTKTADQLLREAAYREGYNKGLHDKGMKSFWHGVWAAFAALLVAFIFIQAYGMWNDNDERAKRFLTAREIEHMKLITGEGKEAPVVEPEGQK